MESYLFLVAVLVISIINWLVKKLQAKRYAEQAELLEREMRESKADVRTAPRREAPLPRQPEPLRQPQPQRQPQPATEDEQDADFREIMGELLGLPKKAKPVPPPVPVQIAPARPRVAKPKPKVALTGEQRRVARQVEERGWRAPYAESAISASVRALIAEPGGLKKAVILREILGPPQSLKSDSGPRYGTTF